MYLFTFVVKKKGHSLNLIQTQKPQKLLTLKMYRDSSSRVKHALEYRENIQQAQLFDTAKQTIHDPKKKLKL